MAIYEISSDQFRKMDETSFANAGLKERQDLQRLLREQIEIISPDTLVISEEFGQWNDSNRRIDLLGVDSDGSLVVIELKRTEKGGHMELQALRYAAMVSAMTFDRAVKAYADYLEKIGEEGDAQEQLLDFLEWEEPNEEQFAQSVRIVLASADFSKELTTSVLWLNEQGLDICCVRLKPYQDGQRTLVDVQQVIPLPETADYTIRIAEKKIIERKVRVTNRDYTKYDVTVGEKKHRRMAKRNAAYTVIRHLIDLGHSPETIVKTVPWKASTLFRSFEGLLNSDDLVASISNEIGSRGSSRNPKHYFCKQEEIFHVGEKTYSLINQWGRKFNKAVSSLSDAFPEAGIIVTPSSESDS